MEVGSRKNVLGWCIIVIATAVTFWVPAVTAGQFELRNEFSGVEGRDRILAVKCWSRDDQLGWQEILPGQSKSWRFKTMNFWPFAFTEFRCQFRTAFGTTRDDDVLVFSGDRYFRADCERPTAELCVWVAKRDGLYHRKITHAHGTTIYNDELQSKWIWTWRWFN